MSIRFLVPDNRKKYRLEDIKTINQFPPEERENINALIKMLPQEDQLKYYVAKVSDLNKDDDWFEDGIAIVRNDEIVILAKMDEYHDCGLY